MHGEDKDVANKAESAQTNDVSLKQKNIAAENAANEKFQRELNEAIERQTQRQREEKEREDREIIEARRKLEYEKQDKERQAREKQAYLSDLERQKKENDVSQKESDDKAKALRGPQTDMKKAPLK